MLEKLKCLYRDRFSYKYNHKSKYKLSRKIIVLLFLLNIFVFLLIIKAVNLQINKLDNPSHSFPNICINILTNKNLYNLNNNFYDNKIFFKDYANIDTRCDELINDKLKTLVLIKEISVVNSKIKELNIQKQKLESKTIVIKNRYDSYVKDKFYSLINSEDEVLAKIKDDYIQAKTILEITDKRIDGLKSLVLNSKEFISFKSYKDQVKNEILIDYNIMTKEYKINKVLIYLLFISPLVIVFYRFMIHFKKRKNYLYFLTFKSLLLTIISPSILTAIAYTLYKILGLLSNFNDINTGDNFFVDYYLAITITVIMFNFLMISTQKKNKSRNNRRYSKKRYNENLFLLRT